MQGTVSAACAPVTFDNLGRGHESGQMGAAGTRRPAKSERPPAGVGAPPALGRHARRSLRACLKIGFRPSYFRFKEEPQSSNCFGSRFATFPLVGIWPFARMPAAGVITR